MTLHCVLAPVESSRIELQAHRQELRRPGFGNANNDPLIVGAPGVLSDRHAKVRRGGTAGDAATSGPGTPPRKGPTGG